MSTTLKYILDDRIKGQNDRLRLKLRIIHNRTTAHLSTDFRIPKSEWDKKNERLKSSSKSFKNINRFNNNLQERKAHYYSIVSDLERDGKLSHLKASQLKSYFVEEPVIVLSVLDFIKQQHDLKMSAGKSGTARTYKDLYNKLLKFSENKDLSFTDIDYKFLTSLESWHLSNGSKYGSLSVYLRTLRSLYNEAIKLGHVSQKHYPFDRYSIKNGEPSRRALSRGSFVKLLEAEFKEGCALQIGRDYYLACFFLHGINWMDLCYLNYGNVTPDNKRISYTRKKTGKSFNIEISSQLIEIINRLKPFINKDKKDFIFPILDRSTPKEFYERKINNRRLKINKYLKSVSHKLSIESFSIYSARHTYATMLWEKSGSASVTQRSLGHKTEEQTQEYLSYFGNEKVDKASKQLFDDL